MKKNGLFAFFLSVSTLVNHSELFKLIIENKTIILMKGKQ
jgi:hypothetical protein